jgi:nucleotide-binding universal stress UspA family protein
MSGAAFQEAREDMAHQLAAELGRRAAELGVEVQFVHERGDPVQALTRVARTVQADAIAVGRSEKPRHRLAGSLSRRLVLNRDLPVIVVVP